MDWDYNNRYGNYPSNFVFNNGNSNNSRIFENPAQSVYTASPTYKNQQGYRFVNDDLVSQTKTSSVWQRLNNNGSIAYPSPLLKYNKIQNYNCVGLGRSPNLGFHKTDIF